MKGKTARDFMEMSKLFILIKTDPAFARETARRKLNIRAANDIYAMKWNEHKRGEKADL